MKRIFLALVMLVMVAAVTGCGDDDHHDRREVFKTQTLSDQSQDAYIGNLGGTLTVTPVTGAFPSVLAGVSPATGEEFRAFLDFPLGGVPLDAQIDFATVNLFVRSVLATGGSVPIRIELVDFSPPLLANYYFRDVLLPVASISTTIFVSDIGHDVQIDITPLVDKAQLQGFSNLQLRILQDLGAPFPGLVEIDDAGTQTAPLLTVFYF